MVLAFSITEHMTSNKTVVCFDPGVATATRPKYYKLGTTVKD